MGVSFKNRAKRLLRQAEFEQLQAQLETDTTKAAMMPFGPARMKAEAEVMMKASRAAKLRRQLKKRKKKSKGLFG